MTLSNDPYKGHPRPKSGQSISQKVLNLLVVSLTLLCPLNALNVPLKFLSMHSMGVFLLLPPPIPPACQTSRQRQRQKG
jgi:hypothetical protein